MGVGFDLVNGRTWLPITEVGDESRVMEGG